MAEFSLRHKVSHATYEYEKDWAMEGKKGISYLGA
jgi:hypothetical protein